MKDTFRRETAPPANKFQPELFLTAFRGLQREAHEILKGKARWETEDLLTGSLGIGVTHEITASKIADMHSELSEALLALRCGNLHGAESALANLVINIADLAERRGWDIAGEIISKIERKLEG